MSGLPLIILCCCIVGCSAFSSGAAYSACTSRTPGHGAAVQTSACPFEVAGLSWTPGEYTISKYPPSTYTAPLMSQCQNCVKLNHKMYVARI